MIGTNAWIVQERCKTVQVVQLIAYVVVGRAFEAWLAQRLLSVADSGMYRRGVHVAIQIIAHDKPCPLSTSVSNTFVCFSFYFILDCAEFGNNNDLASSHGMTPLCLVYYQAWACLARAPARHIPAQVWALKSLALRRSFRVV